MESEQWKPIEGYEGIYEVSSFGRVRSLGRTTRNRYYAPRIMKCHSYTKYGYLRVPLCKNNVRKTVLVHRLVAKAFVPGYFEGAEVNHKDENPQNNRSDNLEWVTPQQNCLYGTRTEKIIKYHFRPVLMLDKEGNVLRKFPSIKEACETLGISQGDISTVCRGRLKTAGGYGWQYADKE